MSIFFLEQVFHVKKNLRLLGAARSPAGQKTLEPGDGEETTLGFLLIWAVHFGGVSGPRLFVDLEMISVILHCCLISGFLLMKVGLVH